MQENEKKFYDYCKSFNNSDKGELKGDLIFGAYEKEKHNEELLASYVLPKQKFDCLYAFIVTKTRIIELSAYSTMFTVSIKRYKSIKKVVFEQAFDDRQVEQFIKGNVYPERVQIKLQLIDEQNQPEEFVWENIEIKENIIQAIDFANKLNEVQANN